ncbi:hypothetical protein D3C80_922530 [compost metagenome]
MFVRCNVAKNRFFTWASCNGICSPAKSGTTGDTFVLADVVLRFPLLMENPEFELKNNKLMRANTITPEAHAMKCFLIIVIKSKQD